MKIQAKLSYKKGTSFYSRIDLSKVKKDRKDISKVISSAWFANNLLISSDAGNF
jgi:hypothetical protein